MKLKDLVNQTMNKRNKQISYNLKKKELKKIILTPEELLELTIPQRFQKRLKFLDTNKK